MTIVRKQYDDISNLYDILSEGDDGMIWFRHNLEDLLKKLPGNANILDCSCGTGNHAIWFAKQGFNVFASDLSEGMLEAAREKASSERLEINFFRSSWTELPETTNELFDLIVVPGNSLSHLERLAMAEEVFSAIRKVLKPGGQLFFDIRNWEKTYEDNSLQTQEFTVEGKDGNIDVIYSYDMPSWNETGHMHVDIRQEEEADYKRYSFDFFPVSFQQLHDAAMKAGFKNVDRGFFPGKEYYYLIIS